MLLANFCVVLYFEGDCCAADPHINKDIDKIADGITPRLQTALLQSLKCIKGIPDTSELDSREGILYSGKCTHHNI